jgi:8-oxo-dGTP pyrophosphatase MutT (NUDIX family)
MSLSNDPKPWRTTTTRPAFANRWLTVVVDEVVLPDERRYEYTRVEPSGIGVGVIGFNAEGQVLLEREYRHGVGQSIWQLPGGLAKRGEDLQEAGLRELEEETGYAPVVVTPESVRYLGVVWDNPAFGLAQSHAFAAWGLHLTGHPRRDAEEFVTLHWRPLAWVKEAVRNGEIQDRLVVAALAYLWLNGLI